MNAAKFFTLAKEKGLQDAQLQIASSKSLSFSLFHHELDNYSINDSRSMKACGIINGKFGSASTEKFGPDSFEFLIDNIILSATKCELDDDSTLFEGSEKYHKKNIFDPSLSNTPAQDKIKLIKDIENQLFAYDKRVNEVESVDYKETEVVSEFYNSNGIKLKNKKNYFFIYSSINGKDGEKMKTFGDIVIGNDLAKFDSKAFVKRIGDGLLAKFGGVQCQSGKYPTVLKNEVFSALLDYFLAAASSEEVQKKSSFLVGKLNQKVASSKLTISEKPLANNIFRTYFDDEGVAQENREIVKHGILTTYFYNRTTAKKDNVQTTANGRWEGSKMGIGYGNIFVKASKKNFETMIAPIGEGVYVTDIQGLGTGMNAQSGAFSCQAEGFMIRDGKIAEPLTLITLSGNLQEVLMDIKDLDDKQELLMNAFTVPDVFVKALSIGGK